MVWKATIVGDVRKQVYTRRNERRETDQCGERLSNVQPRIGFRSACRVLNRYLSIPRTLILESSVCLGSPSLAAAPGGPPTWPPQRAHAVSIISFSRSSRVASN